MFSRSLFMTSLATICCTVLTGTVTNESSIETIRSFCQNPKDFPLFGVSSCVSPAQYTALFLTSIILASVTFLMLVSLFLFLYLRRSNRSKSDYTESIMLDPVHSDKNNLKAVASIPKPDKEISNVLRKIISNPAKNGARQSHIHHSFPIPTTQESLLASSSSFGDSFSPIDGEIKPRYLIPIISESDESDAGQSPVNQRDSYHSQRIHSQF